MAAGLGGLGLPVAGQSFGAAVSTADLGSIFYAGSRRRFNTDYALWTTPRVIQAQLLQLDAGIAAFRVESDTHYLEAWFDSVSGAWTGIVDGVEGSMVNGFFDDVVTFRISSDVAEVKVNDTVVASSAALFQGQAVRLLLSWDTNGAVDADAIAGQVIGGVFGDAIGYAQEGDADWCGNSLRIIGLEESAPNQTIATGSDLLLLQRHAEVKLIQGSEEEESANQTIAPGGDTIFLQRHVEILVVQADEEEAAANQSIAPSSNVTFLQRHQEIS
jgi:hypothetical protein